MKNLYYLALFILGCGHLSVAQQTPTFTQFVFNGYAINPAHSAPNNQMEGMVGRRVQWVGFDNAPSTIFASAIYTIRPKYSYKGRTCIGMYIQEDKGGLFTTKTANVSYSYHKRFNNGWYVAGGLSLGTKTVALRTVLNRYTSDPLLRSDVGLLRMWWDVVPAIRLYSRKMYFEMSATQLYKNAMRNKYEKIGTPSTFQPLINIGAGIRRPTGIHGLSVTLATLIKAPLLARPQADVSVLFDYRKMILFGVNYKSHAAVSGILQLHIIKEISVGFAYDYTISKLNTAASNSIEMMIRYTLRDKHQDQRDGSRDIAKCPTLDF